MEATTTDRRRNQERRKSSYVGDMRGDIRWDDKYRQLDWRVVKQSFPTSQSRSKGVFGCVEGWLMNNAAHNFVIKHMVPICGAMYAVIFMINVFNGAINEGRKDMLAELQARTLLSLSLAEIAQVRVMGM